MKPSGLIPATVTPFSESGEINFGQLQDHVGRVGAHRVFGVAVNGHAGEVLSLTSHERAEVVRQARQALEPGKALIAGIEATSTNELVSEAQAAADAGADGFLVLPPFDARPLRALTKSPEVVYGVFETLHEEVGLPVIVFQYPEHSGIDYSIEVLEALAEIPSVVGIKAGTGDITKYVELYESLGTKLSILAASDAPPLLSMLLHGSAGALIGISVLGTQIWLDLVEAGLRGSSDEAVSIFREKCLPLTTALFENQQPKTLVNPFACTKEALVMVGELESAAVRKPIVGPSEDRRKQIAGALKSAGLLK